MKVLLNIPGINVNMKDAHDVTPLFKAVEINSLECVKLLINAGANVNMTCRDERTAMDYAIQTYGDKHYSIVEFLLKNGMKEHQQQQQKTAADIGRRVMTSLHKVCLARLHVSVERVVELLIKHGEDINAVEGKGRLESLKTLTVSDLS